MPQFSQIASLVQFGAQIAERNRNVASTDSPNFRAKGPNGGASTKSASTPSLLRPLREVKKKRHVPKWDSSTHTPASPSRSTAPLHPIAQHKSTKNTSTATATKGSESTPCLPRTQVLGDKAQRHAGSEKPAVYFTPSSTLTLPQAAKHQNKLSAGMGDTLTTTCGSDSTLNLPQATSATSTHERKINQRPGGEAVTAYPHESSPSSWSQSACPSPDAKNRLSTTDYGNYTISTSTGSPSNVVSKLEALDQVKSVRIQALEKSLYECFDDGRNRSEDDEPPSSTPASPKNLKEGYLAERQLKISTQEHKDRKHHVEQLSIKIEAHERKRSMIMQEILKSRSPKSPHEKQRAWELHHVLSKISCNLKKEQAALDVQTKEINDLQNLIRTLVFKVESWNNLKREQRMQKKGADVLNSAKQRHPQRANISITEEMVLQFGGSGARDLTWSDLHADEIENLLSYSPRTAISLALIRFKGSKEKAFKFLDINESGRVSAKELRDCLVRLKIPWENMLREAGLPRPNNPLTLFQLYDVYDNCPELEVTDLFGKYEGVREFEEDLNRCSTPDAWDKWCLSTSMGRKRKRKPHWYVDKMSTDEVLRSRTSALAAETHKEWMKATFQRLRSHGLSGTACRELVARHLPRGKGPKDCHGIHLLDSKTIKEERKAYNDKVQRPVKKIQTLVKNMMWQRRELSQARTDLYNITERDEELRLEEERKAALLEGFVAPPKKGGKGKDAAKEDEPAPVHDPLASDPEVLKKMKEYGISQKVSNKCLKEFRRYDLNNSDVMEKGEFMRYIRDHAHGVSLSESDYDSAWREVSSFLQKEEKHEEITEGAEAVFKAVNLENLVNKEVHAAAPSSVSASFPPSSKNSDCGGSEVTKEVLDNETYPDAAVHAMFENAVPTPPHSITASFPPSSHAGSLSAGSNNSALNTARYTEATNEVIDNDEAYTDAAVHAIFEKVVFREGTPDDV